MAEESASGGGFTQQTKPLTKTQQKYFDAYKETGSATAVANMFNVNPSTVSQVLTAASKRIGSSYRSLYVRQNKTEKEDNPKVRPTGHLSNKKPLDRASVKEIVSLVEKQDFRCALSGVELAPETSSLDHKHPVSLGGTDEIDNLQWLDANVNRAKGNMPNEDFILMCKRVAAWNS